MSKAQAWLARLRSLRAGFIRLLRRRLQVIQKAGDEPGETRQNAPDAEYVLVGIDANGQVWDDECGAQDSHTNEDYPLECNY